MCLGPGFHGLFAMRHVTQLCVQVQGRSVDVGSETSVFGIMQTKSINIIK